MLDTVLALIVIGIVAGAVGTLTGVTADALNVKSSIGSKVIKGMNMRKRRQRDNATFLCILRKDRLHPRYYNLDRAAVTGFRAVIMARMYGCIAITAFSRTPTWISRRTPVGNAKKALQRVRLGFGLRRERKWWRWGESNPRPK